MRLPRLLLCFVLLPACDVEPPATARHPSGAGGTRLCEMPPTADLTGPDGHPLAVDVGGVVVRGDTAVLLGPQVATEAAPDSLVPRPEWLGARISLPAVSMAATDARIVGEPLPVPAGVEPPTLVRGIPEADGIRVVATSPRPMGAPGSWIWTGHFGPDGWTGLAGVSRPASSPARVGAPAIRRSGEDLLFALPADASGIRRGWFVVHVGAEGLRVLDLPIPLLYLLPLGLEGDRLHAVWVEAETGAGPGHGNSLFRGGIPLDTPDDRRGRLLRRGGPMEIHHPVVGDGGRHVGFRAGPAAGAQGWLVSLDASPPSNAPGSDAAVRLGRPPVDAVQPVEDGAASPGGGSWTTVTPGPLPLTLTWYEFDFESPRVRARTRIPHSLPPHAIESGGALILVGTRFLGAEGPGRFSSVRTAVAVLRPGCIDDTRAPSPRDGRSP